MYTEFDFDEYWDQFTESPDPEFFDPVIEIMHPNKIEDFPEDVWTLFS